MYIYQQPYYICLMKQTKNNIKVALYKDPFALSFIKNQTEEICRYAMSLNVHSVTYIKDPKIRVKMGQEFNVDKYGYTLRS